MPVSATTPSRDLVEAGAHGTTDISRIARDNKCRNASCELADVITAGSFRSVPVAERISWLTSNGHPCFCQSREISSAGWRWCAGSACIVRRASCRVGTVVDRLSGNRGNAHVGSRPVWFQNPPSRNPLKAVDGLTCASMVFIQRGWLGGYHGSLRNSRIAAVVFPSFLLQHNPQSIPNHKSIGRLAHNLSQSQG